MTTPITEQEWNDYEWIETEKKDVFIRGIRKTDPPDDGYHYVEITTFSDTEQKWARAVFYE